MKLDQAKPRKTGINLTALIDILFLLIIFFSVSTQFTNQQAVEIKLPKSQSSQSVSTSSRLVILMKSKAEILVNGQPMTAEALALQLGGESFDREKKVILNIDHGVTHGEVIWLLDQLKKNRFQKVAFGTQVAR